MRAKGENFASRKELRYGLDFLVRKGGKMLAAFLALFIKLLNTPSNVQALVALLTKLLKSLG